MKSFLILMLLVSVFSCDRRIQREEAFDSDDMRETDSFDRSLPTQRQEMNHEDESVDMGLNKSSNQ